MRASHSWLHDQVEKQQWAILPLAYHLNTFQKQCQTVQQSSSTAGLFTYTLGQAEPSRHLHEPATGAATWGMALLSVSPSMAV